MSDDLDVELPDLRVGVLAARTFYVSGGRFRPVGYVTQRNIMAAADTWHTPDAVARCFVPASDEVLPCGCGCNGLYYSGWASIDADTQFRTHAAPADGCECGLYSFRSAQEVWGQYQWQGANQVLAVLSLEGHAVEGSRGWKSERARILAAWVEQDRVRAELAANYPTVRFYSDGAALLADYPAVDNGTSGGQYPPPPSLPEGYFGGFDPAAALRALAESLKSVSQSFLAMQIQVQFSPMTSGVEDDSLTIEQRSAAALVEGDFASRFFLGTEDRKAAPFLGCFPAALSADVPVYRADWRAVAAAAPTPIPSYAEQNRRRLDGTNQKGGARRG